MSMLYKDWLKAARYDLLTIEKIISEDHLTHIVAFHCQQAIEKSLKALAEKFEIEIPKIHNLLRLSKILEKHFVITDTELLKQLDELYIESRYPGEFGLLPEGKPEMEDAIKFYEFALSVFDKVCKILEIDKKELI